MPLVDVILLLIIFAFVFRIFFWTDPHDWQSCRDRPGLVISSYYIDPLFKVLISRRWRQDAWSFCHLVLYCFTRYWVSFLVLEKVFGVVTWLPFASSLNRLLGAVFGFVEGVIVLGIVLYYAMQHLPDAALRPRLRRQTRKFSRGDDDSDPSFFQKVFAPFARRRNGGSIF